MEKILHIEYVLTAFFLSISILYALLTAGLWLSWSAIKPFCTQPILSLPIPVSVIIAVRNEEEGIIELLQDINKQDYPHTCLEVIVINDHSTDRTASLVTAYMAEANYLLHLLNLSEYLPDPLPQNNYKKKAIELAVGMATGKLIITTDGDCRVGEKWISTIACAFTKMDAKVVSGLVTFYGEKNLFEKLQTIEFASLVASGAAALALGIPVMCNGANMAYSREAFLEVGGYANTASTASGDDIFLLQKIDETYPGKSLFLKSKEAIVYTRAKENWSEFLQQRKRWAGKWNSYQDKRTTYLAIFIFISNFSLLAALVLMMPGYYPLSMFLIQIIIKFSVEFVFLTSVLRYLNKQQFIGLIILLQCIYFLYVSFFGLLSQKKGYSWKGRNLH